jgi:hypothetical protein
VFISNLTLWSCLLVLSIIPLMSVYIGTFSPFPRPSALVCGFMALLNLSALAGLRKQAAFLPVPDTWRLRLRLRDRHQYCLLLPWIAAHTLIVLIWGLLLVPVLTLATTKSAPSSHKPRQAV